MTIRVVVLITVQIYLRLTYSLPLKTTGCTFILSNLNPEPIVVSADDYRFLYPEPSANASSVAVGQSVIVSCPRGNLTLGSVPAGSTITATCQSGTIFRANSVTFSFDDITCSRSPWHTARFTNNSCEAGGKEIELGFSLTDESFASEMTICFDDTNRITLYVAYTVTRSIGHHESGIRRPFLVEDDFYNLGVRVNDLYVRQGQRATINGLLGLPQNSTKYIQDSGNYFLARGHLAAKADFVYAPQQMATFHYVNAAPQWQTLNGFNWATAERDVRDYAERNGVDLQVYTGTYGVTTLPHEATEEDIPLYLYADEANNRAIPVPKLFWKVVYNPQNQKGIALLGVNNPSLGDVSESIICIDVTSDVTWLKWIATDLHYGYSYACSVDDFRTKVTYLPQFKVMGLLV